MLMQLTIIVNCAGGDAAVPLVGQCRRSRRVVVVLVISRFREGTDDPGEDGPLRADLEQALAVLAAQKGFREGRIGRNVDDPTLWLLETTWDGPGAYRRALSAYDVKLHAWATLGRAVDEPSAYELLEPGEASNRAEPRQNR
jgi:hypothetical protein